MKWLMKSEPGVYSISDLERDGRTAWEGVRNYQVRNSMRDDMKLDDLVLFYHSNSDPSGVVGIGRIVREAYPDPFQFDPKSNYFDPDSDPAEPRWLTVDVGFVEKWRGIVTLADLKHDPDLVGMEVVRKGSRLSVHPVSDAHFDKVVATGRAKG